ncbi:MAG TPA: GNAT family N-acetyltransferase [Gemmatimonadales bacterium]|nr:GNAT family N-acetyltransferase [Gemmatimonadales bacterium]
MWRADPGPAVRDRATVRDIPAINRLFSEAFTERYRRDGMTAIRVPYLTSRTWQFAITAAADGAFVWRDRQGNLAAFNMVHRSGTEGWMGPLAVRLDQQGRGLGQEVVSAGIAHLQDAGATTIGLETMPRTIENIGFYSRLRFRPGHLTITMQVECGPATGVTLPGIQALDIAARSDAIAACRRFSTARWSGRDFTREMALTLELDLGDVLLHHRGGELAGFVLYHTGALADGRDAEDLRILKLVAVDRAAAHQLLGATRTVARQRRLPAVVLRCQGTERDLYADLIADDWRVQWTDLRMTLAGFPEAACDGVGLSNWEI